MSTDLVVTILAGGRPDLLARTLISAGKNWWEVLREAELIALVNGDDLDSAIPLEACTPKLIEVATRLPIGPATSLLAAEAHHADAKYWLHLEDDWASTEPPEGWLKACCTVLDLQLASQVRLRSIDEPVLKRHMVTGQPIKWEPLEIEGHHFKTGEAHLTFNPSLMRVDDIPDAFPCKGERDAQRNWLDNGHKVSAQLIPGFFHHIGEGRSIRGRQT